MLVETAIILSNDFCKMSYFTICNRINQSKPQKIRIDGVEIETVVSELKDKVAGCLETDKNDIDLLYGGQQLKDEEQLSQYRVKPGVTIYAITRVPTPVEEEAEKISLNQRRQVITALQTALLNHAFRSVVEKMLSNPETLENLIATTPGLAKDYIAKAVIQDPELLAMLADPQLMHKIIEKHPSLGQAATFVAAAVSEEAAKGGGSSKGSKGRAHYSMDQMSDEEDMDTDDSRRAAAGGSLGQGITANQLGEALAALTGARGASSSGGTQGSSGGSSITDDFFRQAMAAAATGAGSSSWLPSSSSQPGTSTSQGGVTEAQLQQLREMGITDESVARRALEASGGDVQQALELIFGDGM